jgi:hypothetical protein
MKAFKKEIKVTLHVFIGEILANMTQVSDVAPGPLVITLALTYLHHSMGEISKYYSISQ